jgi:hypothetical protein
MDEYLQPERIVQIIGHISEIGQIIDQKETAGSNEIYTFENKNINDEYFIPPYGQVYSKSFIGQFELDLGYSCIKYFYQIDSETPAQRLGETQLTIHCSVLLSQPQPMLVRLNISESKSRYRQDRSANQQTVSFYRGDLSFFNISDEIVDLVQITQGGISSQIRHLSNNLTQPVNSNAQKLIQFNNLDNETQKHTFAINPDITLNLLNDSEDETACVLDNLQQILKTLKVHLPPASNMYSKN